MSALCGLCGEVVWERKAMYPNCSAILECDDTETGMEADDEDDYDTAFDDPDLFIDDNEYENTDILFD